MDRPRGAQRRAKRVLGLGSGFIAAADFLQRGRLPTGTVLPYRRLVGAGAGRPTRSSRGGTASPGRFRIEVGDALPRSRRSQGPFDVVFCDIDKARGCCPIARRLLRAGGLFITDSMLPGRQGGGGTGRRIGATVGGLRSRRARIARRRRLHRHCARAACATVAQSPSPRRRREAWRREGEATSPALARRQTQRAISVRPRLGQPGRSRLMRVPPRQPGDGCVAPIIARSCAIAAFLAGLRPTAWASGRARAVEATEGRRRG